MAARSSSVLDVVPVVVDQEPRLPIFHLLDWIVYLEIYIFYYFIENLSTSNNVVLQELVFY